MRTRSAPEDHRHLRRGDAPRRSGAVADAVLPGYRHHRDINKAQIYAWKKGIKTLYYIRLRQLALEGTEIEGCVSCAL
jgi:ribonucleotide reductase alpha subunit